MALNYLFVFCILLAGVSCEERITWARDPWIDPTSDTYITMTSTATGPLRVGDVVNFTCVATGLSNPNVNVHMTEVIENYRRDLLRDSSPVTFTKVIEAADNGKEMVCHAIFFNQHERVHYYNVYSNKLKIDVEGVTEIATKPSFTTGLSVTMSSSVSVTAHRVGETVVYQCDVTNFSTFFMEVRQVKGPYEFKLYVGYQWWRHFPWIMDLSDDGTSVYCLILTSDSNRNSYTLESPRIPINVT